MKKPDSFLSLPLAICFALLAVAFVTCSDPSEKNRNPNVRVQQHSNPDMLNPINHQGTQSAQIMRNIFQKLINVDPRSTALVPVLAESLPKVEKTDTGTIRITYRIRPEAEWPNGEPVTARDVAFTMKVAKAPHINNQHKKPYLERIRDLILYDDDPKKVTFICERYIRARYTSGAEINIIPAHIYDPDGIMETYSVHDMATHYDSLKDDSAIVSFARSFNSEKWQRKKGYIVGSGAYKFMKWESGAFIELKKKKDWWGQELDPPPNPYFKAYPPRIRYRIIKDQTAAINALKSQDIDVMRSIDPKAFEELSSSGSFTAHFHKETAPKLNYSYLALNMEEPPLRDKRTRQALAHLVDVNRIIENVIYGYGRRVIGPVHPSKAPFYNDTIEPYPFDPEKARALLEKAGWSDRDGDGILDRMVDGERVKCQMQYMYPSGSDSRKKTGLLLKEAASKVGVDIKVVAKEWSVFLKKQKTHDFDIACGSWVLEHAPQDPYQLFHTESAKGGSNFPNFGNERTDALIDSIRVTMDKEKRRQLWYELQAIMHERVPYIFLLSSDNRLAIHKRFKNTYTTSMEPGYWEAGFKLSDTLSP